MNFLKVHKFLNSLYEVTDELEAAFAKKGLQTQRGSYTNHYLKINGRECHQRYYIPVLTIKDKGDVGVNIGGIFFELGVPFTKISKAKLRKVIKTFLKVEIYGLKDCLRNFYPTKNKIDKESLSDVILEMKRSREKIIQFSVEFPLKTSASKVVTTFLKLSKILRA